MKQLRNILIGVLLALGLSLSVPMRADSIPVTIEEFKADLT